MPLRSFWLLLKKDCRELAASRAFWLMLIFVGLLVGQGFTTAVRLYAEMSGGGNEPAALPQGLTPLDGILVPTWGAYDLAATLLFPFVAIRLIAAEKESGALKLLLQFPGSLLTKLGAKGVALLLAWLVAWIPGLAAIVLWKSYGGHVYGPETINLLVGHLLRGMLAGGFAVAAASIAESAASAAIVTLGFTVGTWALDFVAAGRGGLLQQIASYTPTAALRMFEHGLLQLNIVAVLLTVTLAGFVLAAIWLHPGRTGRERAVWTTLLLALLVTLGVGASRLRASWDKSENQRNSFARVDEQLLKTIKSPLKITVYLSPEDPRLTDYEQNVLRKLRRVLPNLQVEYAAGSQTGLFENAADHYGEIWYDMNGQKSMERSTIEEVVLDQIYALSNMSGPERQGGSDFSGYPLNVAPRHAAVLFYLVWPVLVIAFWWVVRH